jgi:hypothetical protein
MARVFQDGFELNSATINISNWSAIGSGTTISSTTVRSGNYSGRISSLTSGAAKGFLKKWLSTAGNGPYFGRAYIYIVTYPSAANTIMYFSASTTFGSTVRCSIKLNSDGTLTLHDNAGAQIGSASSVLSTGVWYLVELKTDTTQATGSRIIEGRLNGTVFATSNTKSQASSFAFAVGGNLLLETQTQGEWFFDDVAVNDGSGSFQNSYPGSGKIIHLLPNASGDANTFSTQVGGTSGASNNYTRVNEVPPNDATSYNGSNTLNTEDSFNCQDSGIGSSDTVNVVAVGARFRNNVADTTTAIKFRLKKESGGTVIESANIVPNTTAWNTNGTADPRNFPIITHTDPDNSAWTKSTLDSLQIGYKIAVGGTNRIDVTNIWASVDYTPISLTTSDSRNAKTKGQQILTDNRPARTKGVDTTSDTRSARTKGVNTTSDTRYSRTKGVVTIQDTRNARIKGLQTISDNRNAKTKGVDVSTDNRLARIKGIEIITDVRNARIKGYLISSDNRNSHIKGIAITSDTRSAMTKGFSLASDFRDAHTKGSITISDSRGARLKGVISSYRNAKVKGPEPYYDKFIFVDDELAIHISGKFYKIV